MEAKLLLNDIVELSVRIRIIKDCFNIYSFLIINDCGDEFQKEIKSFSHMMEKYIKDTYDLSANINQKVEFGI